MKFTTFLQLIAFSMELLSILAILWLQTDIVEILISTQLKMEDRKLTCLLSRSSQHVSHDGRLYMFGTLDDDPDNPFMLIYDHVFAIV